ncbi:MAG: hypothetical protein HKO53_14165, partial [Gemmatimonadetes bacterium]|nr:hypothetical protein [Gemmatimonadota bacterium]
RELLPVRDFHYYIDRLTAVQNGFGDRIAIGEGRDVRSVPHPLSAAGRDVYRFRIADQVSVRIPSRPAPVKVYEVQVRPVDPSVPAISGSLTIAEGSGALTRARFTFTPASYVDPRVDNVTVSLEHGLWEDRHWLPYKQVLEVRREIPELDLPVGSMIRATLEVDEYTFNSDLDDVRFAARPVRRPEYNAADTTAFRSGLLDRMEAEGLTPVTMEQLQTEARQTVRDQLVSGLPRIRFYTDRFSSVLRANRAEGVYVGGGASFSPHPAVRVEGQVGLRTGPGRPAGAVRTSWSPPNHPGSELELELRARSLADLGPKPGASGAVTSGYALFGKESLLDPYFSTGATASWTRVLEGGGAFELKGAIDHHEAADQTWFLAPVGGSAVRPVRIIEEGTRFGAGMEYRRRWGGQDGWGTGAALGGAVDRWAGNTLLSGSFDLAGRLVSHDLGRQLAATLEAGGTLGDAPVQLLAFLGGRGTLPGHGFRDYVGKGYMLLSTEISHQAEPGWITARVIGGVGTTLGKPVLPETGGWTVETGAPPLGYIGVGIGTLHDLLRIDGAWGVGPRGTFELIISVDPRLGPYL